MNELQIFENKDFDKVRAEVCLALDIAKQYFIDKFLGKTDKRMANAEDEKPVTIELFKDNDKYIEVVRVFVNGTMYEVPRGVPTTVPHKVARSL